LMYFPLKCASARALPTDIGKAWLRGPVVASPPSVSVTSGSPGVLEPHWRKDLRSSIVTSKPDKWSRLYSSMDPCPPDKTKRSRLNHLAFLGLICNISVKRV